MPLDRVIPFTTRDNVTCNVIQVQGLQKPYKGPVLLVHGAGVRSSIFRPPVHSTLIDTLLAAGYDVWLENWRASIDFLPNEWTLDKAAVYDHPAAVETVLKETGATSIKAIIHCQGSTSFMMAAMAGLLPQVSTIVSNAVSLHPVVPMLAKQKLRFAVPLVSKMTRYLNPQWGIHAEGWFQNSLVSLVKLTHHECDNLVCKMSSFTYGAGFPTLWRHENLSDTVHEWIKQEFAAVPMTFFNQMRQCVELGRLISVNGFAELPVQFGVEAPKTTARISLLAGQRNDCFLWQSQQQTFDYLNAAAPGKHALHVIPEYGHLDVFIGKDAARDTFPIILEALDR
jgi:pimeloyl-ACP methyl ester carboxylesterase